MTQPEAVRAEVEAMLVLVRDRYGDRLALDELDAVRTAVEGLVQAARALRAVRLDNSSEPAQPFAAYRAEP